MESAPFVHRLRVRYSECDPQGVVFGGWYFFYYDVALTEFHRKVIGSYADFTAAGLEIVVAEASIRYLAPAQFDEWIEIRLAPSHLGRTSFSMRAAFAVDDRLVATASARHVVVDAASGRKAEIPEDARSALARLGTGHQS
jgi:acyl-CoA thioester hydrolase